MFQLKFTGIKPNIEKLQSDGIGTKLSERAAAANCARVLPLVLLCLLERQDALGVLAEAGGCGEVARRRGRRPTLHARQRVERPVKPLP